MWKQVILILAVWALNSEGLKLPAYLKSCPTVNPQKFSECAMRIGQQAIPFIAKGDRKYRVPKLNPLTIPRLDINQGQNLKILLKNVKMYGLEKAQVKNISMDLAKKEIVWSFFIPEIKCNMQYNMSGRILILPISGKGDAVLNLENVHFTYSFKFDIYKKGPKGEEYVKPHLGKITYKLTKLYVKFENLFNGDRLLGPETNRFLNENWEEVSKDLGPTIAGALAEVQHAIMLNVADLVPLKEIFPDLVSRG